VKAVDSSYYTRDFDPVAQLFNQLPAHFDEQWLTKEIKRRERQKELLEASLADRVIKSYSAFGTHLTLATPSIACG
jgi:glutathione S-transferase